MSSGFGAIETEYAGHVFRSRLEARWAVFFDVLGIDWKYEHEGYEVDRARYLPDFEFGGLFFEVKGQPEALRDEVDRMRVILGAHSPLPGFAVGESALILLGSVPLVSDGLPCHRLLQRREGRLQQLWCTFAPVGRKWECTPIPRGLIAEIGGLVFSDDLEANSASDGWLVHSHIVPMFGGSNLQLKNAYAGARASRFEHGQKGADWLKLYEQEEAGD